MSGLVDENGRCIFGEYPGKLKDVLGIWVEEVDALRPYESNRMLVKGAIPLPKESYSCGFLCDLLHRVEQKMTEIKTIKMDYLEQAVGTDGMPALSWVIQSDGVCVMQTAYQIQLSDQADFGQLLYDSKKVTSRESWIGCDSPVTFSEIYDGEIYDARLEQPGWSTSDFVPDIDQKFHYLTQEEKEALIRDPLKNHIQKKKK